MEKKYYFRVKNFENLTPPLPHADVKKPDLSSIKGDIEFTEGEYEQLKDKTTLIISYRFCPDFWGEMVEVAKVEGTWKVYVLEDNSDNID